MQAIPDLPSLYYLHNFETLCHSVWQQYRDLLNEGEQEFHDSFFALPEPARALYVRLVSRRGPLFRAAALAYPELGSLGEPIAQLQRAGLLRSVEPQLEDLFRLYRKAELQVMFAAELETSAAASSGQSKGQIEEQLLAAELPPEQVPQRWRAASDEELLEPLQTERVEIFQLLFFGNRYQSLTDFVLSDLGVARHFPYRLDPGDRLFPDRAALDTYVYLGELRDRYYEAVEADDEDALCALPEDLQLRPDNPVLAERHDRLCNRLARQLERLGYHELALATFSLSRAHPARERQLRILQASGELESALQLATEILEDPWCEAELDVARRQQPLLRRKLGQKVAAYRAPKFAADRVQLCNSGERVEQLAAQHLAGDWEQVYYVENSLVNGTFGLALWEQIFAPLPGAFVNPFQSAPLDMDSPAFYQHRKAAVEGRLAQLADLEDLGEEILSCFQRYQGYSNRWVSWRYLDEALLQAALAHIPARHLLAMWRRILFDPAANRSGFPDLLALDPERGYCMIEVKGPGDQLQQNQKRWLRFFDEQEIPWSVLHVEWQG